ncbi:Origin recognition complex subunit 3 [Halocaridina rubra]|uniref:Origin recognition complex subunit 3 n=1 Tax=Halocaridina rubra TaxID=373956 RepID=A0AAN9AAE9_HALRR
MDSTVSVSKGVFAFKKSKSRKNAKGPLANTFDYWNGGEDNEERAQTYKNYTKCWSMVTEITDDLRKQTHAKVFRDLVEFVKRSSVERDLTSRETNYRKHVPTACLLTGVNMADHEDIFGSLVHLVVGNVTPHVARLQSHNCPTVRGAVFKLVSQFMKGIDHIDPELLDELEVGPTVKRAQCTMPVLTSWYQELATEEEEDISLAKNTSERTKRKLESPMSSLLSPKKIKRSDDYIDSPEKAIRSPKKSLKSPRKIYESPKKLPLHQKSPKVTFQELTTEEEEDFSSFKSMSERTRRKLDSPKKIRKSEDYIASPQKAIKSPKKCLKSPKKSYESPRKSLSHEKSSSATSPFKSRTSPPLADNLEGSSEFKKKRNQSLVVIFEDVESFSSYVLQDLILICSEHRDKLPFVFVFGVSTTSAAVHSSLSQDASACIAMETFQAQPSTYYLNDVINEVLMSSRGPFHLGGRTFKLLLDIFLYHDLSVKNFIRAIQVCMIEHFTSNPCSFLCCSPYARKKLLKSATPAQLDIISKLPSFKAFVESCSSDDQEKLLNNKNEMKEAVLNLLLDLELWYKRFCTFVKVVNAITCTLPQSPLGRQVREVLALCLSRSLVETEEYEEVYKMLSLISREELSPLLGKAMKILQDESNGDADLEEFHGKLAVVSDRLSNLDQVQEKVEEPVNKSPVVIKATDRFQLKEKLKELAMQKKKPNAYETVRKELLQLLDETFKKYLQPPAKQPLHEVQFFDSSSVMKRHLIGMPRAALTTALANPHHYLQCSCCPLDDPVDIVTTLPDLSVAYKLHLECGRLINLYDWLQAFVSVVDPEADASGRKIDKKLQARFVQALLELQFLGFVKQTKRKTDHVARLTWGGC